MAMTKLELAAKNQILDILGVQGYPTYARLLDKFDVNLTEDPGVIAYMESGKARIVLNKNLSINQVSTIVRHEILHEYFTHMEREAKFRQRDKKYSKISPYIANKAADYEISNLGYTDKDKDIVRNVVLKDQVLRGLVTEDDYPDWKNKSFEEMLELLVEQIDEDEERMGESTQIGDTGDSNIQNAEELERQANAVSNDAGEMIDGSEAGQQQQDISNKANDIAQQAKDLANKSEEQTQKQAENGQVFDSEKDKETQAKIKKRIEDLQKALKDLNQQSELLDEVSNIKDKEKAAQKAKDIERYKTSPIIKFKDSLNNFIKNQVATGRGPTWNRFNKKYEGSGIIRPGSSRLRQKNIPLINVYFDVSSSFTYYPQKIEQAERVLSTLDNYVRRGQIKINLYYVTDDVYSSRKEAIASTRYGADGDSIIRHIAQTKPTNVIVVTDSDSKTDSFVSIPGAVWILFYENRSNLLDGIKANKLAKEYLIKDF